MSQPIKYRKTRWPFVTGFRFNGAIAIINDLLAEIRTLKSTLTQRNGRIQVLVDKLSAYEEADLPQRDPKTGRYKKRK